MRVLAIDTALEACSAAVLDTERGRMASESLPMVRGHAEALMPLIERVMQQADMAFAALDRVGVTTGPGSFTGLRVGIAARMLADAWPRRETPPAVVDDVRAPDIVWVGRLAVAATDSGDGPKPL